MLQDIHLCVCRLTKFCGVSSVSPCILKVCDNFTVVPAPNKEHTILRWTELWESDENPPLCMFAVWFRKYLLRHRGMARETT